MTKRNLKGQFVYTTGAGRYNRKIKNGKNVQYSRYIWEKNFGEIPNSLIVHHIDGNKKNDNINNLALMTFTAHNQIHSHSPWNKGLTVKDSKEWAATHKKAQASRSETMKKRFKQTWELKQLGLKIKDIAQKSNISIRQVHLRIKRYKEIYKI